MLRTTADALRRRGLGAAIRHVLDRLERKWVDAVQIPVSEWIFDWRFRLAGDGIIETQQSQAEDSEFNRCEPVPASGFHRAMREIDVRPDQDVFLDIGSGTGRALILAAQYPFRRVMGVELAPEFCDWARSNVERAASRLRCHDVQIVNGDAVTFDVPVEATVLYFYNPFTGDLLSRVCENLRRSLAARPRRLTVLYANPAHFEREVEGADWLRKRSEFRHRHRWVIYESTFDETGVDPSA